MKFKYILFTGIAVIILSAFTFIDGPSGEDAKTLITNMRKTLAERQCMTYTANYHYKCYNCEDTIAFTVQCRLLRDISDTLYHGMVGFMGSDSVEVTYDKELIYIRQYKRKKLVIYNPAVYGTTPISENRDGLAVYDDFLDAASPGNTEKLKFTMLPNDTIDKKPYKVVKIEYPDAGSVTEIAKIVYIDPQTGLPAGGKYVSKLNGSNQYEFFMFSNISFDPLAPGQFTNTNVPARYKVSYYQPYALKIGSDAPQLEGIRMQDKKPFQLSAYKGQAVLVGFWKKGTKPSEAAFTYLNDMKAIYGAKNLAVVGIPVGKINEEKVKADILTGKIKFTPLRPSRVIDSLYRVKSLPALYLIDRNGKIAARNIGYYNTAIKDSLKNEIEKALQ